MMIFVDSINERYIQREENNKKIVWEDDFFFHLCK